MTARPTDIQAKQTFKTAERLKSRKGIALLFKQGQSIKSYPLIGVYLLSQQGSPVPIKMTVSVSKKRLKRAVDRNRLKRLIREAWRKEKSRVNDHLSSTHRSMSLIFIFTGKELPKYDRIEKEIKRIIDRFLEANPD